MPEHQFNPYHFHAELTKKLRSLVAICDTWDQLTILSEIADLFYKNVDPEYQELYKEFEQSARRLQATAGAGPHWHNSAGPGGCDPGPEGPEGPDGPGPCDPGQPGKPGHPGRVKEPFNRGFWSRKEGLNDKKRFPSKKVR